MNIVQPINEQRRTDDSNMTGAHCMDMAHNSSRGAGSSSSSIQGQRKNNSKAAFTLIEVMIATFISVIAVSSTYMLITYSRDILRSSSNRIEALNNARGAIEYLRTLEFDDGKLDIKNNYPLILNGQASSYNVSQYDGDNTLKQITLQTAWTSEVSDTVRQVELISVFSKSLHTK